MCFRPGAKAGTSVESERAWLIRPRRETCTQWSPGTRHHRQWYQHPSRNVRCADRILGCSHLHSSASRQCVLIGALKAAQGFFVPIVFASPSRSQLAPLVKRLPAPHGALGGLSPCRCHCCWAAGFMAYSRAMKITRDCAILPQATRTLRQTFRTVISRVRRPVATSSRSAMELQKRRRIPPSGRVCQAACSGAGRGATGRFHDFVWLGSQGALTLQAEQRW